MKLRFVQRLCVLGALFVMAASCDAIVGISDTHAANGGSGGSGGTDASAGSGGMAGTAGADASVDAPPDAIADAPSDQSVGPPPSHGLGCALWPGNQPVTVGCPSGKVITGFSTVLYGNPTGSCNSSEAGADGGGDFQPGTCNADGAKTALDKLCDGLQSCTFVADSNLQAFTGDAGDPCKGTSKFIAVQVVCGAAPIPEAGSEAGAPALPQSPLLDFNATDFKNNNIGDPLPSLTWNDSSGNQKNAIVPAGAGVASPTIALDQTTKQGLVRFSGDNQYLKLQNDLTTSDDLSKGLTAFAVVAPMTNRNLPAQPGWQRIFDFSNGTPQDNIMLTEEPGHQQLFFEIVVGKTAYSFAAPDVFNTYQLQLFSVRAQPAPAVGSSLQKVTLYKGGTPIFEQFMPAPDNVTRTLNRIGMSAWDTDAPFDGYMAQFVMYKRALSDAEMTSAHEALIQSWDLCASTNLQTDPANCGYCGHLCAPGQTCNAGVCEGSMFPQCRKIDLPDTTHYHALCQPGPGKVSWVQAQNACENLGGDLLEVGDKTTSNAVAGATNGPVLVGLTDFGDSKFSWSNGNDWSNGKDAGFPIPWGVDGGAPTTTESCAEIVGSSNWQPVSCTTARNVPWICELPQLPDTTPSGTCRRFLEPKTNRAWDICDVEPASDLERQAVCKAQGGTLLAVQSKNEATLLGDLLERYNGNLPTSAIDLTDGATPFDWTLHDGSTAPFINWRAGEPSAGEEPRCATLAADGTMTAAPCNENPEPVICSLKDGSAPDSSIGQPPPPQIGMPFSGLASLTFTTPPTHTNTAQQVVSDSPLTVNITTTCYPGFDVLLRLSPGNWTKCVVPNCNLPGTPVTTPVTIQAPPVAGVFDVTLEDTFGGNCSQVFPPPVVAGRIAVVVPPP